VKPLLLLPLLLLVPLLAGATPRPEWAIAIFPSGAEFRLEIAADDRSRALGYMFRDEVGPREGMLFLFEETDFHSMWMRNCRVSLDIIWLDRTGRVVDLARELPPCAEDGPCPAVSPARPARYVLEVAGGVSAVEGLEVGDRIEVLSEPRLF